MRRLAPFVLVGVLTVGAALGAVFGARFGMSPSGPHNVAVLRTSGGLSSPYKIEMLKPIKIPCVSEHCGLQSLTPEQLQKFEMCVLDQKTGKMGLGSQFHVPTQRETSVAYRHCFSKVVRS